MEFEYPSTLDPDEIRLLTPTTRFIHGEPLHFSIRQYPRTSCPEYTAVSYTWGDDDATEWIYLDDRRFPVRSNLRSCLFYLARDDQTSWTHLWVDAICIDQSNDAERNAQVRQMDHVYKNAVWVSVWLGTPTVSCSPAGSRPSQPSAPMIENHPFSGLEALANAANHMYWSRFWVVQEFVLARDVEIYSGSFRIPSGLFTRSLCRAAGLDDLDQFGRPGHAANDAAALYRALPLLIDRVIRTQMMSKRSRYNWQPPTWVFERSLADLLVLHHRSRCRDPRDRIFSLLGLVTPHERALLERFFPDYSMPVERVRVIALAHILQCRSISSFASPTQVTVNSEELFLGLGVPYREDRVRLFDEAHKFKYLDDFLPGLEETAPVTIDIQLQFEGDGEPDN